MIRRPPRSTRTDTLFPYTTLFRSTIDVPLAHKDALYVRSHYDGMAITLHDAPHDDEIAVICCYANRGRLNGRLSGLGKDEIDMRDGRSRSEERRVGEECVSQCRLRWGPGR